MRMRADRRRMLLAVAGLMLLSACGGGTPQVQAPTDSPSPTQSPSPTVTASPTGGMVAGGAWKKIAATGPSARRDYSFTGDGQGGAWLFGGRAGSGPLADLWLFKGGSWTKIAATGPKARFGHNAAFIRGRLFVFGGQAGATEFFNDTWAYDPASEGWLPVSAGGTKPAARYGAGTAVVGDALYVTHGFTNSGRFDDTWRLPQPGTWSDVSPASGRPVKRCLHRSVYVSGTKRIVLFGGQTNGDPFLGDTWLYDPATKKWNEVKGAAPSERTLYAMVAAGSNAYVFGGETASGPVNDLWRFDGKAWTKLSPAGTAPSARSGVEGALLGNTMLVFGGIAGGTNLADLWELTLPA